MNTPICFCIKSKLFCWIRLPCPHSFHCLFFFALDYTVVYVHISDRSQSWQALMKKHPTLHHNYMKNNLYFYHKIHLQRPAKCKLFLLLNSVVVCMQSQVLID